jgi:hypothetical protein
LYYGQGIVDLVLSLTCGSPFSSLAVHGSQSFQTEPIVRMAANMEIGSLFKDADSWLVLKDDIAISTYIQ